MSSFYLNETQYFNFIAAVTVQHGCRLVDIDFRKGVIHIDGDVRNVSRCATKLEQLLGRKAGRMTRHPARNI